MRTCGRIVTVKSGGKMGSEIVIAVCDDNDKDLIHTVGIIMQYAQNFARSIRVLSFHSAEELFEEREQADIYMLDIMMPQQNGITLGMEIRKRYPAASIVYITSSKEYAVEAFSVYAAGYILKPADGQEVTEVMEHILQTREKSKEPEFFQVKVKDGIERIEVSQIVYVENVARAMHFHLANGRTVISVQNRSPFEQQLVQLLEKSDFVQPHKSFVVNMRYVDRFTSGEGFAVDGREIPISRSNYTETKRKYLKYLSGGEEK